MASFDVTHEVVIGTVDVSQFGSETELSVLEAAFLLIGRNAKNGAYRFPGPDEGMTTVVTVEGIETNYTPAEPVEDTYSGAYKARRAKRG